MKITRLFFMSFVIFFILGISHHFVYGYNLTGTWIMEYILTCDASKPGQTTRGVYVEIKVDLFFEGSGEFVGKFYQEGKYRGHVVGKIIKASYPYKKDLIVFERFAQQKPYRAIFIGLLKGNNEVEKGHYVDTFGNSAIFEMYRKN